MTTYDRPPGWDFFDFLEEEGMLDPECPSSTPVERPPSPVPIPPSAHRYAAWASATVETKCATIATTPEGSRNHTLNAQGLRAYRAAMCGGLDLAAVTEVLTQAGHACGLGDTEVRKTLESALRKAVTEGPADPPPDRELPPIAPAHTIDPAAGQDGVDSPTPNATADSVDRGCFVRGGAFVLDVPESPPAIWGTGGDVLWARGESLMIAGPMGVGKTSLGGLLIRARLGLGDCTVLGLPVKPGDAVVLYLAMDRPQQAARSMARQFSAADRAVLDERLVVWPGPPPADVARRPEILTLLAEAAGADTVFLDSVKDAAIGLSEDEVGAGYNRARQLLLASGRELVELHHTTKRGANGGPPTQAQDIYGSTWITNGTGSILLLAGEPGDPDVRCRHVRQPMNELGPWRLVHDQASGSVTIEHQPDLVELAARDPNGLTARDAAAAIFIDDDDEDGAHDKPHRKQIEKARRRLDALAASGKLVRVDGSKGGTGGGAPTAWFPAPTGDGTVFP